MINLEFRIRPRRPDADVAAGSGEVSGAGGSDSGGGGVGGGKTANGRIESEQRRIGEKTVGRSEGYAAGSERSDRERAG